MEGKVEAVLAGEKSSFPEDMVEEKDARAAAAGAFPAAIFAFLAPPLSLLLHVACLCAGYLGLDGGQKPSAPAPAASSSSPAAVAFQQDQVVEAAEEDCTEVLEERSRGFTPPEQRSVPWQSKTGEAGGVKH